jgi:integrase/recombinase XerD
MAMEVPPMTKLREQMIQEMTLRGLSANTQRTYLRAVSQLAEHYGRSPDQISNRDIKAYLFHLHQNEKRSTSTCNVKVGALVRPFQRLFRIGPILSKCWAVR